MLNSQSYQEDGMREHAIEQYVSRKVPKKYFILFLFVLYRGNHLVHSKGLSKIAPHLTQCRGPPPTPPTATMEHLQKALVLTTFYGS